MIGIDPCDPLPLPIEVDVSKLEMGDVIDIQPYDGKIMKAGALVTTFEMRNQVRDAARAEQDATKRKQALIDAAAWRGDVLLSGRRDGDVVILEVRDNGIGMTAEVREQCLQTHFSTKRDNALYEGYNAGMGLGLSFVAVVLEHHEATLDIESEAMHGAMFRLRFPAA